MPATPQISIIVPMRNGEPYVTQTLNALLKQADVQIEIIVVNDGSTDASPQSVRQIGDPRLRMIDGPQRGISAAFNAGLKQARGEYLARCDADDLYPPGRLKRQLAFLQAQPDFVATSAGYSMTDAAGTMVRPFASDQADWEDTTDALLNGQGKSHMCSYLFRTEILRKIGGCREWFVASEDADLQFRLAEVGRIAFDPFDAYHYRLHDASITHTLADTRRQFFADCAATFLKQRRAGRPDDLERGVPPPIPAQTDAGRSTQDQIARMLIGDAWAAHRAGNRSKALSLGARALRSRPASAKYWIGLVKLVLKPTRRHAS
jgi:glycosyltransferase involved in cell wall biosynthesis